MLHLLSVIGMPAIVGELSVTGREVTDSKLYAKETTPIGIDLITMSNSSQEVSIPYFSIKTS